MDPLVTNGPSTADVRRDEAATSADAESQTRWRLSVDSARCVTSGFCVGSAPDHFTMEQVSRPSADVVAPDDAVVEAAECCPVEAILVLDARTGTQIAPKLVPPPTA
ncbi:ferredoxin [Micromonospora echinofusca]|uniref:Ferredoxin n=1 Tax=Micromonospora echinofusca TaxID=47858 RepID=A0A1C5GE29_MICEH|nr:ferredoxin [Micromonospora echinofusca]SCG18029.1 Ferredoxin [Micromonospora echinofusca]